MVEQADGQVKAAIKDVPVTALPAADVLVEVEYSSLNYKDGLAVTGVGKVIRRYPMIPGIDLAGTVLESSAPAYRPGDQVIVTGWEMGEKHWGGYGRLARVSSGWCVPVPVGLSTKQAMAIGTAGFTAMLSLIALEEHGVRPGGRPIAVTGATGGVGSVAVALLARHGYQVTAFTGKPEADSYLRQLGATQVLDRSLLNSTATGPLDSEQWGGAVDTVGGEPLAALLRSVSRSGAVAACGNAADPRLNTTVFPFILRGVTLVGIDSNLCPVERRKTAWERLSRELDADKLEEMTRVVPLQEIIPMSHDILKGKVRGRIVVDVGA